MKVSGFTFLRNVDKHGFPFVESIRSALPLCDEFVVNIGRSTDATLEKVRAIGDPRIRIIESVWNENVQVRGFVYAQQASIALFNCTGDWAFCLQADEAIHEKDIPALRAAMEKYLSDDRVEALVFDYIHFYGNTSTCVCSPAWYRRECRIIRNNRRVVFPSDGQFPVVLTTNRKARYPRAALANATIYHYGNARPLDRQQGKVSEIVKYWGSGDVRIDYTQIDPSVLRPFRGTHPAVMRTWLPAEPPPVFAADPSHVLNRRERRHRWMSRVERWFGVDLGKKHFSLVRPT